MAAAVTVNFSVGGIARVNEAFEGVSRRLTRMEQESIRESERAAATREKLVQKETSAKTRELSLQQKAAEKTAAAIDRMNASSAKEAEKLLERRFREAERWQNAEVRSMERNEAKKTSIAARAESERTRTAEREASARHAVSEKMTRARLGTAGRSISGMAGTAMNLAGGAMAIGGGFAVADSIRSSFAAQKTAAQIVNAVTTGGKAPDGATVANILNRASAVSIETGMDKDTIAKAGLAYSRSARGGDFGGVMANMGFFAKMAKTTGTDIDMIAGAAGKLQSQNPNLDSKGMQQMLLSAYAQSKMGSASLTDVAAQFGTLASTRGFYQGSEADNQRKLIGLGQIAASGGVTGDVGTYIKDLAIQGSQHRLNTAKEVGLGGKGLEALGVKYNKQGQMESPEQMISAVFKATGGDIGKIGHIFGSRGLPAFTELSKSFNAAGGGNKGVEAVKSAISSVTAASMTPEDMDKQFSQVMSTAAEKFDKAVNGIKEIIEEKLAPFLERFANTMSDPKFEENIKSLIDAVGSVAEFFVKNPFSGIGAVILGKIGADLAAAAIGDAVKGTLVRLISSSAAPGPGGLAAGSGAGGMLAGGLAVAAGTYVAGKGLIDNVAGGAATGDFKAGQMISDLKSGKLTATQAQKMVDEASQHTSGARGFLNTAGALTTGMTTQAFSAIGAGEITGADKANAKTARLVADRELVNSAELRKAIAAAVVGGVGDGMGSVSSAARNQPMTHPSRGGTQ